MCSNAMWLLIGKCEFIQDMQKPLNKHKTAAALKERTVKDFHKWLHNKHQATTEDGDNNDVAPNAAVTCDRDWIRMHGGSMSSQWTTMQEEFTMQTKCHPDNGGTKWARALSKHFLAITHNAWTNCFQKACFTDQPTNAPLAAHKTLAENIRVKCTNGGCLLEVDRKCFEIDVEPFIQ